MARGASGRKSRAQIPAREDVSLTHHLFPGWENDSGGVGPHSGCGPGRAGPPGRPGPGGQAGGPTDGRTGRRRRRAGGSALPSGRRASDSASAAPCSSSISSPWSLAALAGQPAALRAATGSVIDARRGREGLGHGWAGRRWAGGARRDAPRLHVALRSSRAAALPLSRAIAPRGRPTAALRGEEAEDVDRGASCCCWRRSASPFPSRGKRAEI